MHCFLLAISLTVKRTGKVDGSAFEVAGKILLYCHAVPSATVGPISLNLLQNALWVLYYLYR
jgi:hypothetical protein